MFYKPLPLKGEIRNLKQITNKYNQKIWVCQIFLEERLISEGEIPEVSTRQEAIKAALKIAKFYKDRALLQIELKAVGNKRYVKWVELDPPQQGLNGFYAIFQKGKQQFAVKPHECQDLEKVLNQLKNLEIRSALIELGYLDHTDAFL